MTDRSAGFFHVARPDARPALPAVAALARRVGLPLLVDAAAELPPAANLRRFIEAGADLVVFSGGKAIGGPMASGILCGRRELVASALLQQLDLDFEFDAWQPPSELIDKAALKAVPRHGIGRACKVGKEQIVGLLLALEAFAGKSDAARTEELTIIAKALVVALETISGLGVQIVADSEGRGVPHVQVAIPAGVAAEDVAQRLHRGIPSVRVDSSRARYGCLLLVPTCLKVSDAAIIAAGFAAALS